MILSQRIKSIKASPTLAITARAKQMKSSGVDVVNFAAGEPDWDTPKPIKQAAIQAINSGFTKYTPTAGLPELRQAICKKFKQENNLTYEPDQIIIGCGAKHCLYNILQVIADSGDEVIIPSPYWVSYPEMVRLAGAVPVILNTQEARGFKLKTEDLEKSITKKTRALILNSPSNPTGAVYTKEEIADIAKVCVARNIYCISDEIYEKLIYDNQQHVSIASLNKKIYALTFTVNGLSKTFSMTGWRIGYLAASTEAVSAIAKLQSQSTSCASSISQKAALAALELEKNFITSLRDEFQNRRDVIIQRLDKIGSISYIRPSGAFYVFCNIAKTGLGSGEFCQRLLQEARVAVIPGEGFGSDESIRISFATSKDQIDKGMDRIERWLKDFAKKDNR